MTALSIVLCRLLGFPQSGNFRIEIGFLPIAVIAWLYGPIWAGVAYGLSDLIGAAIFTGVNPLITLVKVAFGVAMGVSFYRRRPGFLRSLVTFLLIGVVLDVGAMLPIFVFWFAYTPETALVGRLIGFAVNTPVRVLFTWLLFGALERTGFPGRKEKEQ